MIVFDQETRQFSVVEDQREFGVGAYAAKKAIGTAFKGIDNVVDAKTNRKRTLWGRISGRNAALDKEDQRAHELEMARIKAGTDSSHRKMRSMDHKEHMVDRKLDHKEHKFDRKMDYKTDAMKAKYADRADKRDYKITNKKTEGYFDRNERRAYEDWQNRRDYKLAKMKEKMADRRHNRETPQPTAIPWKKRI